jgi:glycosyltransferase involved in cell wall biosynthesis
MRVLMLVQQMDERDWLRAFIVGWVRALAARVDQVDVLTLEMGEYHVPDNVSVYSMGKERGKNRLRELSAFHRHMLRLAPKANVIFSHMTPRYVLLAAPYAALFRKPQVLWYTHRQPSAQLRLALAFCWRIGTASPESFPLKSSKVRALGHGIETDFYAPATPAPRYNPSPPRSFSHSQPLPQGERGERVPIIHVARLMPIKHQDTLIRALADVPEAQAVFIGDVPEGQEAYLPYVDGLKSLAAKLGVTERVKFTGGLLSSQVRDWYRRAAVAVNLSPDGLFDKTALESMSAGIPTVVSSAAFDHLLGDDVSLLRLDSPDDAAGLAERLKALMALLPEERARMGQELRARVVETHSLEQLMPRLVNVFRIGEVDV